MGFKICAKCGFKNLKESKYCAGCGTKLEEVEIEGEIKKCCVAFIEILGYENFKNEIISEEELNDFLLTLAQEINFSVEKYDGKVGKYIWPEIMVWFGAPKIVENPFERAILSIFEIKNKIKELSYIKNIKISLRAGLNYGDAVLCFLGNKDYREYTLLGDTVNTAQRVKEIAKEGEILVIENMTKKLSKIFELKEKGKFSLKGKKEEINLYEVIEPKKERGKIRGIEGLYSEMVGREKEMEEALLYFEEFLKEKKLRGIILTGEPGIGKSRFLSEFIKNINKDNIKIYETRFLPFGQTPYFPFINLLKKFTNIKETDNKESIKNKIDEFIKIFPFKEIKAQEILYEFLGVESPKEKIEKGIFQNILFFIFKTIFEMLSKEKEILFYLEDFHWADASSLALLHFLIEFLKNEKIFIIIVSRQVYEREEIFKFLEHLKEEKIFKEINLKELEEEETNLLIENLLSVALIKPYLREIIYKKSEGNPLFVEEMLRNLIETGIFEKIGEKWVQIKDVREIELPDTVEEIILSRIDNLPLMEKIVLQRASIIGRIFWDIILQELVEKPVFYHLQNLEKLDFIKHREGSSFIGIEYIFKHYLIREAIYKSIMLEIKKKMHSKVGETLEKVIMKEHIKNYYKTLAYHFENGERWEKCAFYYLENGKILKDKALFYEACENFKKAKEISENHHVLNNRKFEINLNLAKILSELGEKEEARNIFDKCFSLIRDESDEYELYYSLAHHNESTSNYKDAFDFLKKSFDVAKNNIQKINSLLFRSWLYYLTGALGLAIKDLREAIEMINNTEMDPKKKNNFLIGIYNRYAIYKMDEGELDEAIEYFEKAIHLAEKNEEIGRTETLYNNLGDTLRCAGKIKKGEEKLLKAKEWAEKTGNMLLLAIVHNNLGELYNDIGMNEKAYEKFKFYLDLNKKIKNRLGDGYGNLGFGRIYLDKLDFKNAEERFLEALKIFEEVKSKRMLNFGKCDLAILKIKKKEFDEAENLIKEIFQYGTSAPLKELIYRSYVLKAILLFERYKESEDFQELKKIFEIENEAKKFEKGVFNFVYTLKLKEVLYNVSKILGKETEKYEEDFKKFIKEITLNMDQEKREYFIKKYELWNFVVA